MRDILLAVIVFGSLPFILRRPQIGVIMYVWLSVMNPHRLTWGFSYDFGYAAIIAIVTVTGLLFSRDLKRLPMNSLTAALLFFCAWTAITTVFAFYPAESYERWESLAKTQVMAFLIPVLFYKKEDVRVLVWVIVLSIAYYGTKGGLWTLTTEGLEGRVFGPAKSYIADNNTIAVAIIMTIPLMRYLQTTTPHRYVRWGLTAMMLLGGVAVLGTYSRGALVAVAAMVALLWWKGRQKVPVLFVAAFAIPVALSVMPEKWYERMETIGSYHQEASASMRLNSWGMMVNIANDRPIVGGGFELAVKDVYDRYSPDPAFPPQVGHSIYFQALGEHGYVGLALYLFLLVALWRKANRTIYLARGKSELTWARDLALMSQVSLMGFAVGGAFLNLLTFDVPFYLAGITLATLAIAERELRPLGAPSVNTSPSHDVISRPPAAEAKS